MGGLFSPKLPDPPAAPEPPSVKDAAAGAEAERRRRAGMQGRASTILSRGQDTSGQNVVVKKLLGQ